MKPTKKKGRRSKPRAVAAATFPLSPCDCRARNAFHKFLVKTLTPVLNIGFSFTIPPDTRAVIELVTARILVPAGELARLRLVTALGSQGSNLDLTVSPQGVVNGKQILVATHSIRAYTDGLLDVVVNRDNDTTTGTATVCISGYLEPLT